ncbi:MAG TPA: hypothetical protein VMX12_03415 [Acidimicrobiia bacterium]|nr:hypothetical protein [Acidimicrobiia bacterium]
MRTQFYQVVGSGAFTVDYPTGITIAHRARAFFEAHPTNKSVVRGIRTRRLRALSQRESDAMRSHAEMRAQMAAAPAAAPPKPAVVKSRPMRDDEPIVVLPDNQ